MVKAPSRFITPVEGHYPNWQGTSEWENSDPQVTVLDGEGFTDGNLTRRNRSTSSIGGWHGERYLWGWFAGVAGPARLDQWLVKLASNTAAGPTPAHSNSR
jgi:hypothetical protein